MMKKTKQRIAHSLRVRFFICIALAAAVFVAVMLVLNVLFFDDYYMFQKKNNLVDVYDTVNEQYNGDIIILTEQLQAIEDNNNIRISIVNKYGLYIYDTIFMNDRGNEQPINHFYNPMAQIYIHDKEEIQQKGYLFSVTNALDGRTNYLMLLGKLDTDDMILLRVPMAALEENQSFNFVFLIVSALVALLSCLIAGFFIGGKFTRPVTEMTDIANHMAKLDFSKRYTGEDNDELGELGRSINQMADHLEAAIAEMEQINAQLQTEIEKKQQIDTMRKEFLINVSHDLKTPIALIQGYAEGLRVGINESEEDKNYYCDIIIDESKRMNLLVHQLLDLSRLEEGTTVLNMTEFDAYELAEDVIDKTKIMWQEKQLRIDLSGIGDHVLTGDYDMLERALLNYVTNAIDHTPAGHTIRISTSEDMKHIIMTVHNEGSTLAPEELEKIWDKFYKLDKSRTRVSGSGSGIGLSIVRATMAAHQGGCGARNTQDGMEFYLSLPKTSHAAH